MFLRRTAKLFSTDIGIDLGTSNSLLFIRNKGIILCEPSVVAVSDDAQELIAVGGEAWRMIGRTPANMKTIRPMKNGVVAYCSMAEEMIKFLIRAAGQKIRPMKKIFSPRVLIAVPYGLTEVEARAVQNSAMRAGAGRVYLVEAPIAAAIGAGLPVSDTACSMIVDIGGGTAEVAVISMSGIVEARCIRSGGDKMNEAIIQHLKHKHNLLVGERSAEEIKIRIGNVSPENNNAVTEVKGLDLISGLPKRINVSAGEVRTALKEPLVNILDVVKSTLEKCPPELAADLIDLGIMLSGGGALLKGLDKLISEETGLPVLVAENPLETVANGIGIILQEIDRLERFSCKIQHCS